MLRPTVVVDRAELVAEEIRLTGDRYHHLFRVRRLSAGDELRLTDGAGRAHYGRVVDVTRRWAVVVPGAPAPANEAEHRVEILVGALRRERASWLVEKATEIGVGAVRFFASQRSPRRFGPATFERLRRVARSAVEQSHRARLPELTGVHSWSDLPRLIAAAGEPWLLDPNASGSLEPASGPTVLLVGPEGGWSADEVASLQALGCRPACLGQRTLRVETAALVGLASLLAA